MILFFKKVNEQQFIDNDTYYNLVIYDYRTPVGCARMFDEKGDIVFGRIAVIPEKRHKHLGSYILHELEKKARELGYPKAKLSDFIGNGDKHPSLSKISISLNSPLSP